MFTNFSATIANLRERGNKIANTSFNNNQISEISEGKTNKAYFIKNLDSNRTSDSNLESDSNIKSDSNIESENKNDNDSISTPLQSLQSFINIINNTNKWFASNSIPYTQEKLVQILNKEAIVPKQ